MSSEISALGFAAGVGQEVTSPNREILHYSLLVALAHRHRAWHYHRRHETSEYNIASHDLVQTHFFGNLDPLAKREAPTGTVQSTSLQL